MAKKQVNRLMDVLCTASNEDWRLEPSRKSSSVRIGWNDQGELTLFVHDEPVVLSWFTKRRLRKLYRKIVNTHNERLAEAALKKVEGLDGSQQNS